PDPDHAVDLQRVHPLPAHRRRADLPDRAGVHLHLPDRVQVLRIWPGRRDRGGDDAHQFHAGDRLSDDPPAPEGGIMRDYESTFSKVILVLFSMACMAFFALPLLWLLTAPFNPMTTLAVELPDEPSLDNFRTVFKN